jgi:hypothetical protein
LSCKYSKSTNSKEISSKFRIDVRLECLKFNYGDTKMTCLGTTGNFYLHILSSLILCRLDRWQFWVAYLKVNAIIKGLPGPSCKSFTNFNLLFSTVSLYTLPFILIGKCYKFVLSLVQIKYVVKYSFISVRYATNLDLLVLICSLKPMMTCQLASDHKIEYTQNIKPIIIIYIKTEMLYNKNES